MRKLLLFFAMLSVSIGAWADDFSLSHDTWCQGKASLQGVARIRIETPGKLSSAITALKNSSDSWTEWDNEKVNTLTYQTCKIVYIELAEGAYLNQADIEALPSLEYETIDLQDAFCKESADGEKKAFTFTNAYAKNVILPDGWTKEEVNACGQAIAEGNTSFGSAYSQNVNGLTKTGDVTRYYYDNDGVKGDEYTGGQQYQENGSWYFKSYTDVNRVLDPVDGNPVCTYTNNFNRNKTYTVDESSVETKTYSWGGTYLAVTLSTFDVALNDPTTKYYKTAEDGGTEMNTWEMALVDGVYYYGGTWNNNEYENGKEAVVKTIFTYQDPFTYQQVTLEADDSRISTDKTYATIDFGSNSKEFEVKKKYFYTYKNLKNEEVTESFDEERSTITLKQETVNALIAETNEETVTLGASVIAYVNTPNSLADAMQHCFFDQKNTNKLGIVNKDNFSLGNVKALTISGNAVARDWCGGNLTFGEGGHLDFDVPADELNKAQFGAANGATRTLQGTVAAGAMYGASVIYLDLKDVKLDDKYCDDLVFTKLNILVSQGYNVEVWLPAEGSGLKTIPADFGTNVIREICIPSNIETIRTRAFPSCDHIWTTKGDESWENENTKYDNGAYSVILADGSLSEQLTSTSVRTDEHFGFKPNHENYTYGTYTFGSNLKLIESYAFPNTRSNVKDVYVLNTTAPECHVDAFGRQMYNGNGGYSPEIIDGIITRECYVNNGRWLTMLHYPRETTDPQIQRYTDPTRDYSIATGLRDGKGATIYFPNHTEFQRAYNQGTYGYTWNAWDTERYNNNSVVYGSMSQTDPWSAENQAKANELYTEGKDSKYSSFYDVTLGGNSKPGDLVDYYKVNWDPSTYTYSEVAQGNLYPEGVDYRGWHQFVLTAYAANTLLEEEPYRSYITDNEWWTICPEFDITYAEAIQLFGTPSNWTASGVQKIPYVSKLKYVRRTYGYDGKNVIYLNFSNNLMVAPEVRTNPTTDQHGALDSKGVMIQSSDLPNAGDVIMSAGVPYLIKPNLTASGGGFNRQFRVMSSVDYEKLSDEQKSSTSPRYIKSDVLYQKIKNAQEMNGLDQMAMVKSGTYTVPVFVSGRKDGEEHGYTVENVEMNGSEPKIYTIAEAPYEKSTEWNYTFVGTLYKSFLPHYCYFLGWDSENNCAKFYYHNGNFDKIDNEMRWANGTGVIVPIKQSDLEDGKFPYAVTAAEGKEPAQWKLQTTFSDDSFMKAGSPAKLYVMDFNTPDVISVGEATSIEAIESVKVGQQKEVYDLQGRKVTTMSKGIYIVGGKKYVVK